MNCSKSNTIKIGIIGPFSGEGATYGMSMKRGIDLAIKETNESGGVLGKTLVGIYEDDKLTPKDGINAITKLINYDKVQAIIGSAASRVTLAIAPFAEKSKVVLISPISTADTIKYSGDYIFRNVPPNNQQGITAACFVYNDLNLKNSYVLFKNDDYGLSLAESFIDEFRKIDGEVIGSESYMIGTSNFRNQLNKIRRLNPDIVFFPGNYEESGIILKQARELNIQSVFVGGDGSYSPELIRIAGKAAEGTYYTIMSLPQDTSSNYLKFLDKYQKEYNEKPDVYSVYSYDAANVIFESIKKGNNYLGKSIKDTLYEIEYYGITGKITFDKYGEVLKNYSIYTVRNGSFVCIK